MIKFSDFLVNHLLNEAPNNSRLYRTSFQEQSSKEERAKIHESRSGVDSAARKTFQSYVKTSSVVNPAEVDRNETPRNKQRREEFQHHFHRAVGKNADENDMHSLGSGHIFRGQAHPPDLDADGYMVTRRATSWSTEPSVANANARRNQNDHTSAHHIIVLHHRNETGHRIVSLAAKGHADVGMSKEGEVVSGPGRYKILKSEPVGHDALNNKPIIKHTIEYHDSNVN